VRESSAQRDSVVEIQDDKGVIYTYTSAVIFTHSSNNIPHSRPASSSCCSVVFILSDLLWDDSQKEKKCGRECKENEEKQ